MIGLKFTRSEIHKQAQTAPMKFTAQLNMAELKDLENDLLDISPVKIIGEATFSKNERYIFDYTLSGEMTLPCARTLEEVKYPFKTRAREIFSPNAEDDSDEIKPLDGEVLDLTPYIKENILLEIPYRVFASKETQAKAPKSGKGWSLVSEEEQKDKIDPRLKKLESFFKNRTDK